MHTKPIQNLIELIENYGTLNITKQRDGKLYITFQKDDKDFSYVHKGQEDLKAELLNIIENYL